MLTQKPDLFVLGASGFVGSHLVDAALDAGLKVGAWARTEAQALRLNRRGVLAAPPPQIPAARVVVDLIQPKLPQRLTEAALARAAQYRVEVTRAVLKALPACALYFSVSGVDDFDDAVISHHSPFARRPHGFARIGLDVRREVLASGVDFASLHLGTVYGPGKSFAASLFPKLAKGHLPVVGHGDNRLPLIHVEDAARAIVHLAGLDEALLRAHPWILTDGAATTQRELLELGARLLGGPAPRSVPRWLAAFIAGSVAASSFSRDVPTDPSATLRTGFALRYACIATGLPASIAQWRAA